MSVYLLAVASHCSDDGSCPGRGGKHLVSLFHIDPYGTASAVARRASGRVLPLQRFGCLSKVPDTANCHCKVNLFGADRLCPAALLHFTLS